MNSWHELPRAAFDLETTGRDPHEARIVTASIVLVNGAGEVVRTHEWMAAPEIDIPAEASAVHGVTNERAQAEGLPPEYVTAEVLAVLEGLFDAGIPVMAFNAPYDFTVLGSECRRYGLVPTEAKPVIDPFVLNKHVHKYRRGKRTLVALCEEYLVDLKEAHTSAADALATIRLADCLAAKYPQLHTDAASLHDAQIDWCREQAASFQEYLRRTKPEAVISGDWPVHAELVPVG
ncbi:3'-5' exonuclease [Arthrobacter monumenti]